MPKRTVLPQRTICQLCDFAMSRRHISVQRLQRRQIVHPTRAFSTARRMYAQKPTVTIAPHVPEVEVTAASASDRPRKTNEKYMTDGELEQGLRELTAACKSVLSHSTIPQEKEVVSILSRCEAMAGILLVEPTASPIPKKKDAASALLSLDQTTPKKIHVKSLPSRGIIADELSQLAYSVVQSPPVYITPKILDLYVQIQAALGKPETLPEVLHLYANKPLPVESSSPIRYTAQNPDKVANAIPAATADLALQTAIYARKLVAAMDIIETAYRTTASRRAKFVRKGLLPTTGLAVAPVAAYTVASQLGHWQTTMEPVLATQVAFAGITAYLGFTAIMGVVAVTTANDQMDRVTWAQGVPLRQRWIREEERAAMDKVAGAWGFRESWRRGEEEGEEWDLIREWIHRRAMMLDRVELMEGME